MGAKDWAWPVWVLVGLLLRRAEASAEEGVFRISEKIYSNLEHPFKCYRLFNGTHEVGCQSERYGNTGSLALVEKVEDIWLLENEHRSLAPFIIAVDFKYLARPARDGEKSIVDELRNHKDIKGILVLFNESYLEEGNLEGFSGDVACPGSTLSGYPGCAPGGGWNPSGSDFYLRAWNKPMFLLRNNTQIEIIRDKCYKEINYGTVGWPRCGVRLKFWMFGAVNTETCMRRNSLFDGLQTGSDRYKTCAPLGDHNVLAQVPPTNASVPSQAPKNNSILVLATRMDSFSGIDKLSPGFQSCLLGVTVLLAVSEALGRNAADYRKRQEEARAKGRGLLFAFLHGEAMDFLGSQSLVESLRQGVFPNPPPPEKEPTTSLPYALALHHLGGLIEVGQMGFASEGLFAHVSHRTGSVDSLLGPIKNGSGLKVEEVRYKTNVFPPASLSTFLRRRGDLPSLLLADFKDSFKNKYYNSFVDTGARLAEREAEAVRGVEAAANGILASVADWLGLSATPKASADVVEAFYACFAGNASWSECNATRNAVPDYLSNNKVKNVLNGTDGTLVARTYVSTVGFGNPIRSVVNGSLSFYLGDKLSGYDRSNCSGTSEDGIYSYHWLRRPEEGQDNASYCVKAPIYIQRAFSPAFEADEWDSKEYSTWTESSWYMGSLEVFFMSSTSYQGLTLGLGFLIFGSSIALAFVVDRNSDVLFPPPPVAL